MRIGIDVAAILGFSSVAFILGWIVGWMKGEDHEFWYWKPRVEALIEFLSERFRRTCAMR